MPTEAVRTNRQRQQKQVREKRVDQNQPQEETVRWEEAEASLEDFELTSIERESDRQTAMALSLTEAEAEAARRRTAECAHGTPEQGKRRRTGQATNHGSTPHPPKTEPEEAAWNRVKELEQELFDLQVVVKKLQNAYPLIHQPIRTDKYPRLRGKKLTEEERRAMLHLYEVCMEEKNSGRTVSTADPILRTAVYFGAGMHTVKDVILDRNREDKRGKYIRVKKTDLQQQQHRQKSNSADGSGQGATSSSVDREQGVSPPRDFGRGTNSSGDFAQSLSTSAASSRGPSPSFILSHNGPSSSFAPIHGSSSSYAPSQGPGPSAVPSQGPRSSATPSHGPSSSSAIPSQGSHSADYHHLMHSMYLAQNGYLDQ
ncbi:hypothetical protein BGZ54_000468 [Gamsiella multidivaricata]|nr:hypothetical protein BGZ54_000468 [Gamsiella multidivaricata]